MAKRRKGRTFRKKMRGGQEEEERKYSPVYSLVDISKLPEDYKKKPQDYCGEKIDDNPYFDLI